MAELEKSVKKNSKTFLMVDFKLKLTPGNRLLKIKKGCKYRTIKYQDGHRLNKYITLPQR